MEARSQDIPSIAIVISCYNYEKYVGLAIDSVLRQAVDSVELVVVDDGSTDNSVEEIKKRNVNYVRLENSGQLRACIEGVKRTLAPYILFLDADDELLPGSLQEIIARIEPSVAKIQFNLRRVSENGEAFEEAGSPRVQAFVDRVGLVEEVLLNGVYHSPPTSGNVFRRDLCEILEEALEYDKYVDGAIVFAAPFFGYVVSIGDDLGLYRIHSRNVSGLGRGVSIDLLRRNIDRFLLIHRHLASIINRKLPNRSICDVRNVYYYCEMAFFVRLLDRSGKPWREFCDLLISLNRQKMNFGTKVVLLAIFTLALLGDRKRAQSLMSFRGAVGRRSLALFVRAVFGHTD